MLLLGATCASAQTTLPSRDAFAKLIAQQRAATKPDFTVFIPDPADASLAQTGNEHFLCFDGPDGSLMTIWTQSTGEGQPDQHIAFARSDDEGKTWSKPRVIAGPAKAGQGNIASWAFPLVSKRGRIYVPYSQHIGKFDSFFHTTGWLDGIFSDDNGVTWSPPATISLPRTSRDNPDASFPPNIICWQKPQRLAKDDRYFAGISRWTSKAVFKNPGKNWMSHESVVEFMRFENIDDNPPVDQIAIKWFAFDRDALSVAHPEFPQVSICQEPAIVKLPDGRLFCVLRTMQGSPFWTISSDLGETWKKPARLLDRDGGDAVKHPLSPCPIYDAGEGRYVMLIHNNDGNLPGADPKQTGYNRRPIYLLAGRFEKDGQQPVRFAKPKLLMDHDGTPLGAPGSKGRVDLAMYDSFTIRGGRRVLWYPDRKFFLHGRIIGDEWLAGD